MKDNISVVSNVSLGEIVEELDREQSVEIIKMIDRRQEDWDFTIKMASYFVQQMQSLYDEEFIAGEDGLEIPDKILFEEVEKLHNLMKNYEP